jgi:cytochrome P450
VTSLLPLFERLPTRRNRQFRAALGRGDALIRAQIDERRKSDARPNDLLTMLIEARDEESGEGMTDQQLRDEVITIFSAGHETTANALTWTWYLLSKHPAVRRRLEGELDQVLGGRVPAVEDLARLEYATGVVKEAMRLYPPAWIISRRAIAADRLGGYDIPEGSIVLLSPWVTHRHPRFWENPEGFEPERFEPARAAALPRYAYFPFGGGPRLCIGNNFAMMEAVLLLATMARRYRLDLDPGHLVDLDPLITLRPRTGVRMQLTAR